MSVAAAYGEVERLVLVLSSGVCTGCVGGGGGLGSAGSVPSPVLCRFLYQAPAPCSPCSCGHKALDTADTRDTVDSVDISLPVSGQYEFMIIGKVFCQPEAFPVLTLEQR